MLSVQDLIKAFRSASERVSSEFESKPLMGHRSEGDIAQDGLNVVLDEILAILKDQGIDEAELIDEIF